MTGIIYGGSYYYTYEIENMKNNSNLLNIGIKSNTAERKSF
jgi:hypothetical protein